ncbi:MAG: DUF4412 domain-containing protein [Deltaproteobacteria bacterium]|nr:DUF4412 domain-containing protein [Deltaproteobacteria bacterium]
MANTPKWLVLTLSLLALAALAPAAQAADFSADTVMSGQMQNTGKIYVKGDHLRMDMNMRGVKSMQFIDLKTNTTLVCTETAKVCMSMQRPLPKGQERPAPDLSNVPKKKLGTEKVSGYECDKYELETPKDKKVRTIVWVSQKLGYPIKSVHMMQGKEISYELVNIKEGGVSDDVFQPPADFKVMPMPTKPLGGMGGAGGMGGMGGSGGAGHMPLGQMPSGPPAQK